MFTGLKTVASADPSNLAKSLKVANTLMHGDIGVKADVSNALGGNPKIDASACLNLGDAKVSIWSFFGYSVPLPNKLPNHRQTIAKRIAKR